MTTAILQDFEMQRSGIRFIGKGTNFMQNAHDNMHMNSLEAQLGFTKVEAMLGYHKREADELQFTFSLWKPQCVENATGAVEYLLNNNLEPLMIMYDAAHHLTRKMDVNIDAPYKKSKYNEAGYCLVLLGVAATAFNLNIDFDIKDMIRPIYQQVGLMPNAWKQVGAVMKQYKNGGEFELPSFPENNPGGRIPLPGPFDITTDEQGTALSGTIDFAKMTKRVFDQGQFCGGCRSAFNIELKMSSTPPRFVWSPMAKVCSACKVQMYCSPECQKADWQAGHKKMCKKL